MRHYGFLGNGQRAAKLTLCRALLALLGLVLTLAAAVGPAATSEPRRCPACGTGYLHRLEDLPPLPRGVRARPKGEDTS